MGPNVAIPARGGTRAKAAPAAPERDATRPWQGELESALGADTAAARAELRRQIARLEACLAATFGEAFPRRGLDWSVPAPGGPRLLGIGELEEVRDGLAARVAEAGRALVERTEAERANRDLLERMIAHPERHRWLRISRSDIGEPGCGHWHSRPRFGLLGMLLGWWRVRVSSGCPLAGGRRAAASRP
ncbi:MAG: hypothetical protein U0R52_11345 [Solirubrobacterales bacterium]